MTIDTMLWLGVLCELALILGLWWQRRQGRRR